MKRDRENRFADFLTFITPDKRSGGEDRRWLGFETLTACHHFSFSFLSRDAREGREKEKERLTTDPEVG